MEGAVRPKWKVDDRFRIGYKAMVYLQGGLSVKKGKGSKMTSLTGTVIEQGRVMVVRFGVSGEVFVTAEKRNTADPRGLALYAEAFAGLRTVGIRPTSVEAEPRKVEPAAEKAGTEEPAKVVAEPEEKEPQFRYPIHISSVNEVAPKV
ncbi:unnamed protein product, partial [marine sediment metagenome]